MQSTQKTLALQNRSRDFPFLEKVPAFIWLRCGWAAAVLAVGVFSASAFAQHESHSYQDEYVQPYYPGTHFPKLTTPQWIGEEGVDAVVTLGIDDMRDTAKYETYLRPILERLKQIDGRAPVSIMTCQVDPADPQLTRWIKEGLSIEVHTVDHPCPCLQGGSFETAKSTYERCVDMMSAIAGNHPVAFRMPCCDSRNTPSPRFWAEIFNRRTRQGHFLQADSSVFNVFTSSDPELPPELVSGEQGEPRFKKYIPFPSFVNTIENYPYPYVIGRLCWQFPCMVPSDWEAQNLHRPFNPQTVQDMKAALDATVIKRGMFNLVFHPHGWIRNDQVNELIDYAQEKYGKRVKFLTFKQCMDRINQHLLMSQPLREPESGQDNGVRIVDLNHDGFLDVLIGNEEQKVARIWEPEDGEWRNVSHKILLTQPGPNGRTELQVKIGQLNHQPRASLLVNNEHDQAFYHFQGDRFSRSDLPRVLSEIPKTTGGVDRGVRLRDLDGDGVSEIMVANAELRRIFRQSKTGVWERVSDAVPALVDDQGRDRGARFVDLDHDGRDDVIVSNEDTATIDLYDVATGGFTRKVELSEDVPAIVRDGTNNGAWFAKNHLWIQNERTHRMSDGVDRRSFADLLGDTEPGPRSPEASHRSLKVRPGFTVELVAAEPLVMDPVAIDWGPDGKLWVVEMADYPLGMDDQGEPGGRVRYLEDTDGDGKYDQSTLFLDRIPYPTGVIAWRDGVIISAAPEVFFAADRDGDGKAEFRQNLYRGFVEGNQQHRVNGFERGLDNWLYLANGDSGGVIESVKTGKQVDIRGRDLRIRPDEGQLDPQAGRTQFGRHRDDHGNWFGCSNPLPVRHYVLQDHYLRRNPHYAPPSSKRDIARVDNTQLFPISRVLSHWSGYKPPPPGTGHKFTSACSTMVYRDQLIGGDFSRSTFTCEPVHNAVHRRLLVPSGVSFESVRPDDEATREFLASTDSWFRPATVTTGPDGAIWVVDMYRLVIEHPEWIDDQREKELFLRAGHDRGRIYRVYPRDHPPRPIENLSELDTAQLVERLAHPGGRVRDLAQALLIERRDDEATAMLNRMVIQCEQPLGRLHALCTLDGLEAVGIDVLQAAVSDHHPTVQRHAIRIAEAVLSRPGSEADELLKTLEESEPSDAQARLQLCYTLGFSESPQATSMLARMARKAGDDPFTQAAVISSLGAHNLADFHAAIVRDAELSARYRQAILRMAVRTKNETLLAKLVTNLCEMATQGSMPATRLISLTEMLQETHRNKIELGEEADRMIRTVAKNATEIAEDANADASDRVAAIGLLEASGQKGSRLLNLVAATQPADVQIAAATALVNSDTAELLDRFRELSPRVRQAILDQVIARQRAAMVLMRALKEDRISESVIGAAHRQRLRSHVSADVKSAAQQYFQEGRTNSDKRDLLRSYSSVSQVDGDASLGQVLFQKHCSACHRVAGLGHEVGPDLGAIKNRSPLAMLTAILDPNAAVEDKYRSYNVLTVDGVAETGVIVEESAAAIQLQMAEGKRKSILRDDIDRIQSTGVSLMPEGMEKNLSPAEMNHLLAFLGRSGPPPKNFAGNDPATVHADDQGVIVLAASRARIFGQQIRFEPQYQNIGYWDNVRDRVEWTFRVPRAGRYEVWLDYACPDHTAGNPLRFNCGTRTLTGEVKGTGTWDDYREMQLGILELTEANHIAVISAGEELNRYLFDLRAIKLRPVR